MSYKFIRAAAIEAMASIDMSDTDAVNNFINEAIMEKCERVEKERDLYQEAIA